MRNVTATTVVTPDHLDAVVAHFSRQGAFAFDVETVGPHRGVPTQNEITWLGMATAGMAVAIPMGHPNGNAMLTRPTRRKDKATGEFIPIEATFSPPPPQMRPSQVFAAVRPLFFSERTKIAHNATFDLISVAKYFDEVPPAGYSDTIVLQWLLDENLLRKNLKSLVEKYYRHAYDGENVGKKVESHEFWKVARYQYLDAKYTWLLHKRFSQRIKDEHLEGIAALEMDLLGVLLDMGITGAMVDEKALRALEVELAARLVTIEADIYRAAGRAFNLNAPAQKAQVLYAPVSDGGQGLAQQGTTDGGTKKAKRGETLGWGDYTTDAGAMSRLAATTDNDVVSGLVTYQDLSKILGTYVHGYLGVEGDPKKPRRIFDGRVHADLVQYGTVSGRFSCREPNLQNIPRPTTDLGKKVRGLFIAPPGCQLVVADYGQIELVVLAHFIKTGRLFEGFARGVDPHSATGAALVGMDPVAFDALVKAGDPWAKDIRQAGKGVNFACVPLDTQALTRTGFKTHDQIAVGEDVLGYDGTNLVWTPVREVVRYDDAPLVRLANTRWSAISTPNHRWFTRRWTGRGRTKRQVEEVATTERLTAQHEIILSAPLRAATTLPITTDEAAIIAWLHTDGHIRRSTYTGGPSQAGGRRVGFHGSIFQKKARYVTVLDDLLAKVPHRRYVRPETGIVQWALDPGYLRELWHRARLDETTLEQFVLALGAAQVAAFYEAAWQAEGWTGPQGQRAMSQNEGGVLEAMHTAAFLCGHDVTRTSVGHAGNLPNWTLLMRRAHVTMQRVKRTDAGRAPVWCLRTDHENFVMRQGSRIMLTGNTVYGAGPDKVADMAGTTVAEAKRFMAIHERQFPEIYAFKRRVIATAKARPHPHLRTLLGRVRRLPEITSRDFAKRGRAERQAVNSLIQGSAADLIKYAMVRISPLLPDGCSLSLSVHDELVVISPDHLIDQAVAAVREAMTGEGIQALVRVPLSIDVKVVTRWSEAK